MEETTKTDNELIAEFMERPYRPVMAGYEQGGSYVSIGIDFPSKQKCLEHCNEVNVGKHPDKCFFPLPAPSGFGDFELHYNTSWDWLIPAVEKIEQLGYSSYIMYVLSYPVSDSRHVVYFENEYGINTPEGAQRSLSKIEATYKAVISFIHWYNANK